MAKRRLFGLLVGIDEYPDPRHRLKGCVNDVTALADFIDARARDELDLRVQILKNDDASRDAVISGFRQHLSQAGPDDAALFYYAGHGAQQVTPPELWHLEPDRLDETLVCHDSRIEGHWDLADKELATLIAELAARRPHIAVILDCCHSGSGTRAQLQETAVRRIAIDHRHRPAGTYLLSNDVRDATRGVAAGASGWTLPKGRHVLMAACRDSEEAKEYHAQGQVWGAFSWFLRASLEQAGRDVTYRDLLARTQALVRGNVSAQVPQLEATETADLDQPFLGGAIADRIPYFPIRHDADLGWVMGGGAVHGIAGPVDRESTTVAVFPFDASLEALRDLPNALARGEVLRVLPQQSVLRIDEANRLEHSAAFKAVVTGLPLPPLTVRLEGDAPAIAVVRDALATAGPGEQPSLYVREARDTTALRLIARDGEILITRPSDDRPLVAQIRGYTEDHALQAIRRLEHIARWMKIAELRNPASRLAIDAMRLILFDNGEELGQPDVRLSYSFRNGKWHEPAFRLKLKNESNRRLYCAVLALSESFAVYAGLFPTGGVWLDAGAEAWAFDGRPIPASVPDDLSAAGITERHDLLKLIVSDAEFDATLLEQPKLDAPALRAAATRGVRVRRSTLNRLMNRVQTREIGSGSDHDETSEDWTTSEAAITTVRPREMVALTSAASVSLGVGVAVAAHPAFGANIRLSTVTEASRDLGNRLLPDILREDLRISSPLRFSDSTGHDPGLTVLELSDVNAPETVTRREPLRVVLDSALGASEHLVPVAFDGEFFLPLGHATREGSRTVISVERLPNSTTEGRRSLTGSIRIFFQKIVSENVGSSWEYPILAVHERVDEVSFRYEKDPAAVRARVAAANEIVLCIHGILGDTRRMAARMHASNPGALILTFDYENLNTPIPDIARGLGERLAAVGLAPGHGKICQIVAHSLGGLVSRWFIEREGGHEIVSHLVMLGTPNGGWPWSRLQDLATTALGIAFNRLSTIVWPAAVLEALVNGIEKVDVTLDQMQPGSEFLELLRASPDPHVPYTVITGNTSIIRAALEPDLDGSSRMRRLLDRLAPTTGQRLFHRTAGLAFFNAANDLAVSVESMIDVAPRRAHPARIIEAACDHLTYFASDTGRELLAAALAPTNGVSGGPRGR